MRPRRGEQILLLLKAKRVRAFEAQYLDTVRDLARENAAMKEQLAGREVTKKGTK